MRAMRDLNAPTFRSAFAAFNTRKHSSFVMGPDYRTRERQPESHRWAAVLTLRAPHTGREDGLAESCSQVAMLEPYVALTGLAARGSERRDPTAFASV